MLNPKMSLLSDVEYVYELDNVQYKIFGNEELHEKLQTDVNFFLSYLQENSDSFQIVNDDNITFIEQKVVKTTKQKNRNFPVAQAFYWDESSIDFFLSCLIKWRNMLGVKRRQKVLWEKIRREFERRKYYKIQDYKQIERKFHNIKQQYNIMKTRIQQGDSSYQGSKMWKYYNKMECIFEPKTLIVQKDKPQTATVNMKKSNNSVSWHRSAILLLLNSINSRKHLLNDEKLEEILWMEVKADFENNAYSNINTSDMKYMFDCLKKTHQVYKGQGQLSSNWKYFDLLEEILSNKFEPNIPPKIATIMKIVHSQTPLTSCAIFNQLLDLSNLSIEDKSINIHNFDLENVRLEVLIRLKETIERSNNIEAKRNEILKELLK